MIHFLKASRFVTAYFALIAVGRGEGEGWEWRCSCVICTRNRFAFCVISAAIWISLIFLADRERNFHSILSFKVLQSVECAMLPREIASFFSTFRRKEQWFWFIEHISSSYASPALKDFRKNYNLHHNLFYRFQVVSMSVLFVSVELPHIAESFSIWSWMKFWSEVFFSGVQLFRNSQLNGNCAKARVSGRWPLSLTGGAIFWTRWAQPSGFSQTFEWQIIVRLPDLPATQ